MPHGEKRQATVGTAVAHDEEAIAVTSAQVRVSDLRHTKAVALDAYFLGLLSGHFPVVRRE
jgi:hypothetical protein